ncbi:hypothetical protein [Streptomyces sp. IB2014 016-6]|uniref:hypothetical protein n=1 Tax=Streptomyces sp. IB2014 016-6 TaxID=2517818 RepID=UPI0011C84C16|nr:hypothetical protein [Streptomyces sp. IB2014 016-6]TXL88294.1 hypothetical protein EW053_19485 [Streptomyces sp. IB2014 016-6]
MQDPVHKAVVPVVGSGEGQNVAAALPKSDGRGAFAEVVLREADAEQARKGKDGIPLAVRRARYMTTQLPEGPVSLISATHTRSFHGTSWDAARRNR